VFSVLQCYILFIAFIVFHRLHRVSPCAKRTSRCNTATTATLQPENTVRGSRKYMNQCRTESQSLFATRKSCHAATSETGTATTPRLQCDGVRGPPLLTNHTSLHDPRENPSTDREAPLLCRAPFGEGKWWGRTRGVCGRCFPPAPPGGLKTIPTGIGGLEEQPLLTCVHQRHSPKCLAMASTCGPTRGDLTGAIGGRCHTVRARGLDKNLRRNPEIGPSRIGQMPSVKP
jgi:hypothetical protein